MEAGRAAWLPYIVLFAGLTYLQFLWGRRANWRIIRAVAAECEKALEPRDQTYTWIGGLIGYRADYVVRRGDLNRVEATLTALPRHSLLYFPISWAWRRHDTLFLLWRPNQPLHARAHLYPAGRRLLPPRIQDVHRLHPEWVESGGRRYRLLYSTPASGQLLKRLVQAAPSPLWRHLSINPDEGAVYCRLAVKPGQIGPVVKGLADVLERL